MNIDFNKPMHVYFIGIGGISMSGLAGILLKEGYKVSGSDAKESELTKDLEAKGAAVYYDQSVSHITDDVDLVVYTAAIHKDNPEYIKMVSSGIPYMSRAQFLGELMKNYDVPIAVSGTHGKTTTTTMVSEILLGAGLNPTISVGGVVKSLNSAIHVGAKDYFVFEACEYTNSFLSFFPKISIILNIEEDHLDFFKDLSDIRNSFHKFALLLPSDGFLVINGEIPNIDEITASASCPFVTYGLNDSFDYYAEDISFDKEGHPSFTCVEKETGTKIFVALKLTGMHNVSNALAAIAAVRRVGVSEEIISSALLNCGGSKRRFEYKGAFNGVTVIDDYAHHPTEIKATLKAARNLEHDRLWCVFQPHTYTRTKAFLHQFADSLSLADKVIITDVYAAREKDEYGVNALTLFDEMKKKGIDVYYIKDFAEIKNFLLENCVKNDLLITMGAGDVVKIADSIVSK